MAKLWIYLVLIAFAVAHAKPQNDYEDPWDKDFFDDYGWYDDVKMDDDQKSIEDVLTDEQNGDNKDKAIEGNNLDNAQELKSFDELEDYQFEDNRSELKEQLSALEAEIEKVGGFDESEEVPYDNNEDQLQPVIPVNQQKDDNQNIIDETKNILNDDEINNDSNVEEIYIGENPIEQNLDDVNEETQKLLNDLSDSFDDESVKEIKNDDVSIEENGENDNKDLEASDKDDILDKPIEEEDEEDSFEEINYNAQSDDNDKAIPENAVVDDISKDLKENVDEINKEDKTSKQAISKEVKNEDSPIKASDEEDTVDKVYEDLDTDLKNLFDVMDKLTGDEVSQYEEKYGKPYNEDLVLSQREDSDDVNLSDIFPENASPEILEETKVEENNMSAEKLENDDESEIKPVSNEHDNKNEIEPIYYSNDALVASDESIYNSDGSKEENKIKMIEPLQAESDIEPTMETSTIKYIGADNLTPEQYDDLMRQFATVHKNALNTQDDDFGNHVAPIHITLNADEPVTIQSPNYPEPYPTNNVIDWIFDGDGFGIELNITDFSVNGMFGDYLLVKPGGVDDTSKDGLVFSYHLNEPRRYRFLDVDRLFVRFFSNPGMPFFKGFEFSVKMVVPPPSIIDDDPEPEALLIEPPAYLTVNLGGRGVEKFLAVKEQFLEIVADMATMYINANGIDPGMNSTSEVARIVSVAICNTYWPSYETCVEVKFGVPVVYDDEPLTRLNETDLRTMWETYFDQDPFASRLRRLNITEFEIPNDAQVMMVWAVIGVAVVVAVVMLAFALWRLSCVEQYARMPLFSDTDSLAEEKRSPSLYPTPHQPLPSLYTDNDLKWDDAKYDDSTRVDMGGFPNKGYVRDDMYDFDSDEDVAVVSSPRDRSAISPRDIQV